MILGRRPPKPPLFLIIAVAALVYSAYLLHDVLIPFALSFALAYLLNPVIHFFEVRGLRRDIIVLALYLIVAVSITLSANFMFPAVTTELSSLQVKAPEYFQSVQNMFGVLQHQLAEKLPFGRSFVDTVSLKMYDPIMKELPHLPSYVLGLLPLFSLLFLVPFITFFVLMDSKDLLLYAIQVCPSRYVEQALHVISEVDASLGNYIRGILIIALAIASASWIGLKILGVDYALAIALLSGLASFIPYFGALLGMVVGGLVAFFQYHNVSAPLQVMILFVGIRLGDEAFVQPLVARHSVHLHPMIFLLSLMVGGKLFGFIGLLFAVPAACVIKSLIIVAWEWYITEAQIEPRDTVLALKIPHI